MIHPSPMHRRLIIAGLASAVLVLFFGSGLGEHLDFQALRETLEAIRLRARAEPLAVRRPVLLACTSPSPP